MRFTAPVGLTHFFSSHGFIEIESPFSENQIAPLLSCIDQSLATRLKKTKESLPIVNTLDLFAAGRDISRISPEIKNVVQSKILGEIVYELTGIKPLRFAYDQVFRVGISAQPPPFNNQCLTLQDISSLQGELFGLLLTLEGTGYGSAKTGSLTLFSQEYPIDFPLLYQHPDQCHLLIVLTSAVTVVRFEQNAFHPFAFKKLGYFCGDKLKDDLNPIVMK
jgi:hypothetical protein